MEGQKHLFVEQAEGYVKALKNATSQILSLTELFEHWTERYSAGGEGLDHFESSHFPLQAKAASFFRSIRRSSGFVSLSSPSIQTLASRAECLS
jgi:hypothetical protein